LDVKRGNTEKTEKSLTGSWRMWTWVGSYQRSVGWRRTRWERDGGGDSPRWFLFFCTNLFGPHLYKYIRTYHMYRHICVQRVCWASIFMTPILWSGEWASPLISKKIFYPRLRWLFGSM